MEKITTSLLYHYTYSETLTTTTTLSLTLTLTQLRPFSFSFSLSLSLSHRPPILCLIYIFFSLPIFLSLPFFCWVLLSQGSPILFTATQIFIHQRVFLDLLQLVAFMTIPFNI